MTVIQINESIEDFPQYGSLEYGDHDIVIPQHFRNQSMQSELPLHSS